MFTSTEMSSSEDVISMHQTGVNNIDTEVTSSSYDDPLADVFGSAPPSPSADHNDYNQETNTDHAIHDQRNISGNADPSDIPRLRSIHVTNGYREGIALGKEQSIQAGFDEGYMIGAEFGLVVGYVKGVLESLLSAVSKTDVQNREMLQREIDSAKNDLASVTLFSSEYFDEDGIWRYHVQASVDQNIAIEDASQSQQGQQHDAEADVTFRNVATQHPVVARWLKKTNELTRSFDLQLPQDFADGRLEKLDQAE